MKSEEGLRIKYRFVDRKSNTYKNEDVAVKLNFGSIDLNWKPRTYNRFLRFARYIKFKDDAYQQQYEGLKFRHNQVILLNNEDQH